MFKIMKTNCILVGRCMAVDRELACIVCVICCCPLNAFGVHFAFLVPILYLSGSVVMPLASVGAT